MNSSPWTITIGNLIHVYEASLYRTHSPDECDTGICRRLSLDDALRDLVNVYHALERVA